ncbi:RNA polymerase sigma-70 factor, sigma-E family [Micromonospora echinaurantiaca]|uniref:RNA polymerase sigma-70 factor, sigma-E family n=1 Tax=Micromonospora echinaurantiaca TaxID=47857 RepID=A0A1C5II93_9ACTN|nr:SigE family RNA polymerase sigma factor [Micromonospora echinaurantiaca]SCG57741.1 RNA polymerase sigma-70 factor, sigma-E family [Micromonospora echinaurantiaca]
MTREEESEYREYVSARLEHLRRVAYLLCHDWHAADDLVSTVLLKLFRSWRSVRQAENLDAYVRGMLTNAWLDELRRPWRRHEHATVQLPESWIEATEPGDRHSIGRLLLGLSPRQRAVVILRYYCDLSVEQTARLLGVSDGTGKSQSARALETLRSLAANAYIDEG